MSSVKFYLTLESKNVHFGDSKTHLEVSGDGSFDHLVDTFKAFAIACGFQHETVEKELDGSR